MSILVTIGLLVLPTIAVLRNGVDLQWAFTYAVVISAITYWVYARDKRRAEEGEWRVPEARLHLLDLLGGWPGGFLAQRRLRHKCSKGSFQFVFWIIVLLWQFAAADSLQNWEYSKMVLNFLEHASEHGRHLRKNHEITFDIESCSIAYGSSARLCPNRSNIGANQSRR